MTGGQFQKTYRLSVFNPDVDDVLGQLKDGLPGKYGKVKRGEILDPRVTFELIDVDKEQSRQT